MQRNSLLETTGKCIIGVILVTSLGDPAARAQQTDASDAALKDRVIQLIDRLDAPTPEAREAATTSLIKLGPKIVSLLPDPSTVKSTERKDRLERIRACSARPKTM